METELVNIRRWLFEDFKARAVLLVTPLLQANPGMGAFDLMAAVEAAEAPLPLNPERKAFLLDQYLVSRWAGEAPAAEPVGRRPRRPGPQPRKAVRG